MNILILGSGGREHALAWKIAQSPLSHSLFIAPGNAGTDAVGSNITLDPTDFDKVSDFVDSNSIDLIIVGPEAPLVEGIVDFFKEQERYANLKILGPSKEAAQLEGSKDYAKEFMLKHDIPTARHASFSKLELNAAYQFLDTLEAPYVLKADGLAAGKGVLILDKLEDAKRELELMLLEEKFGAASNKVVIEEFIEGIEMSVFVLTDGISYKILPEAKDYKRIGEGDTGLNTGGMGAVSPVPFADSELMSKIEKKVIVPSIQGIKEDELDYKGFLFIGLMISNNEPYVIEYNVRLGDPETEVILPRIDSDLLLHIDACLSEKLENEQLNIKDESACTVMLVSGGYPEKYEKNKDMTGFEEMADVIPFHAGTKRMDNKIITNGGRVLALTALGENYRVALSKAYENAEKIQFEGKRYRTDIGFDLMNN